MTNKAAGNQIYDIIKNSSGADNMQKEQTYSEMPE
jgi:hypothetical protein